MSQIQPTQYDYFKLRLELYDANTEGLIDALDDLEKAGWKLYSTDLSTLFFRRPKEP
jgi:hypothetical protein